MKISVPVISKVDLLVVGMSASAVGFALECAAKGKKVFAITRFSHPGEAEAFSYDFAENPDPAAARFFPEGLPATPNAYKLRLEDAMIGGRIDFLYRALPVKPVFDAKGLFCGMLIADRTGFQIIEAKAVLDATPRLTAARVCGVPMKTFRPGKYRFTRYLLSGASGNAEAIPGEIMIERRKYRKFRFSRAIELPDNTPRTLAAAEIEMRKLSWSPDTVYASDGCRFDLDDGICEDFVPSETLPAGGLEHRDILLSLLDRPAPGKSDHIPGSGKPMPPAYEIVRMDRPCRFRDAESLEIELDDLCVPEETCDVLVAGGGTAGAPAAAAAGKAGARTILAESLSELGGITTAGRICCYWFGNVTGYTAKLDAAITAMGPHPEFSVDDPQKNCVWKSHRFLLDAADAGADIRFGLTMIAAVKRGDEVAGIVAAGDGGVEMFLASALVDATGNADVAAAAGAETETASSEEPSIQGAGLSPVIPGMSYTNTDFQFIIDHDVVDTTRAFVMARHKFAPEFDVVQIPDTRERRRIMGEIRLEPQDFYTCRTYRDTINLARSNFDTHGFIVHPMFMIQPTAEDPHYAEVPLRALMPKGLKRILVTGLAVSAHRDCMPLIRMQPDVQNQGYAAGLAAAEAAEGRADYREIDVRKLQKKLVALDILPAATLTEEDGIPGASPDDPHAEIASVFIAPEKNLPQISARFAAAPSLRDAMILAFHGDGAGEKLLREAISGETWDKGWDYKGMDQFGRSMSEQDAVIFALTRLGAGEKEILGKLERLVPESEFSHFRAVCFALYKRPAPAAAAALKKLLNAPDMKGFAVGNFRRAAESNGYVLNETRFRNSQLKEFYLARALKACAPGDAEAEEILASYRKGLNGIFAMFA